MVSGSGIPSLPHRPGADVTAAALKELSEKKAKGARRQSRRQKHEASLLTDVTTTVLQSSTPVVLPNGTACPGPCGLPSVHPHSQFPAPITLSSPAPAVADFSSGAPIVTDFPPCFPTAPQPLAFPSSPFPAIPQAHSPSLYCTESDAQNTAHSDVVYNRLVEDILLLRDRTEKGILVGLRDDGSELTDLHELERRMNITSSSGPEDDTLSDTSELTDLDTLERIMNISCGSRKKRTWSEMTVEQRRAQSILGLNRTARKLVLDAQTATKTVVFDHFSLDDAIKKRNNSVADGTFFFSGADGPRRAVSADGYDLVYHFPRALRGTVLEELDQGAAKWASVAPITATSNHDFTDAYREGTFMGQTQLCQFWHSPGHLKDNGMVCRHIRQTGPSFSGAFRAMEDFSVVAAFASTLLKIIDPCQHLLLWDLRKRRCERFPEQKMFSLYNPTLLWECCEVVYNRWSPPHSDRGDPNYAWACIIYFGSFRDAWLEFPQLGLKVCLRPGDMVFFRGRDLIHTVPNWGDGDRNFLIYFTHEGAWANVGMEGQCTSEKIEIPPDSVVCSFKVK